MLNSMTTWWHEWDEFARANCSGHDQTLAPHLVALLDDVEARFVAAGGDAMRWDDPHAIPGEQCAWRDTLDEEYGRLTNPEKYAIVEARLDAWVAALTAPSAHSEGQACADVVASEDAGKEGTWVGWPDRDAHRTVSARTVTPRNGAPSIHLMTRQAFDPDELLLFDVGVAPTRTLIDNDGAHDEGSDQPTPVLRALHTPDCACDACDHGSDDLLRELDQWMLTIVDGSFEVTARGDRSATRTSFFGGSNLGDADATAETHTVTGRSWWPGKRSRPMMPPF